MDDDCSILRGKTWDQPEKKEYNDHFSVFFWLSPEYFHYYFPGIILRSLQEIKEFGSLSQISLAVDHATAYICKGDVHDDQWRNFTYNQMYYVKEWYLFIMKFEDENEIEEHRKNVEALLQRLYPQ